MADETFEAWIEDCKKKIRDLQSADLGQSGSFNAILSQYLIPFHYFKMDWTKTRPTDSERVEAGTAQERGGSAIAKSVTPVSNKPKCVSCGKPFDPRTPKSTKCYDCWRRDNPRKG